MRAIKKDELEKESICSFKSACETQGIPRRINNMLILLFLSVHGTHSIGRTTDP